MGVPRRAVCASLLTRPVGLRARPAAFSDGERDGMNERSRPIQTTACHEITLEQAALLLVVHAFDAQAIDVELDVLKQSGLVYAEPDGLCGVLTTAHGDDAVEQIRQDIGVHCGWIAESSE